ncbi:MAG: preprotein translocase subunit YajC [Candidatus Omnitrophica bacterium]|nr:preprotein translocase subunit YajC [Candidatus Omnitrophota bacterium]MBI2174762.1 preprotein translocase subunit YajC [Candidatus Omnitrophota bacterium]MBI3010215.1 preprotein translocase subunit YajC [Candidatus Omnitrophota bacterium]
MPQETQSAAGPMVLLLPYAVIFFIFYMLVFRPKIKEQKEHQKMLQGLKKHDDVVTSGGLFGTIVNIKSDVVTLRIDENVRVEVERAAIARIVKRQDPKAES